MNLRSPVLKTFLMDTKKREAQSRKIGNLGARENMHFNIFRGSQAARVISCLWVSEPSFSLDRRPFVLTSHWKQAAATCLCISVVEKFLAISTRTRKLVKSLMTEAPRLHSVEIYLILLLSYVRAFFFTEPSGFKRFEPWMAPTEQCSSL